MPRVDVRGPARLRRARGFSILETTIALLMVALIMAGVAAMFQLTDRIANVQINVADMQQSLRVAQQDMIRHARMAGRGGLPRGDLPQGIAIAVINDMPENPPAARVAPGDTDSPEAVPGSDVLVVRGVFNTPLYQLNPTAGGFSVTGDPITGGRVTIRNPSPKGVPQDTQALIDAVAAARPEALLLVSTLGIYAVVELDHDGGGTDVSDPNNVILDFLVSGGTYTDDYVPLSTGGGFPQQLRSVSMIGILEEYRYYVREEYLAPGDDTTELSPRLSRARVYPGSDAPYGGTTASYSVDIADNILDLQVALGVDRDNNGVIDEADPVSAADDWVYNSPLDDETDAGQVDSWNNLPGGGSTRLFYLRLTTVARTDRRDVRYVSPAYGLVEDHDYAEPADPTDGPGRDQRMYRRLRLQTLVDLRNIS